MPTVSRTATRARTRRSSRIDPATTTIALGKVTINDGLYLLLDGSLTIGIPTLVTIAGVFTFTFVPNPFLIQVTAEGNLSLTGIGSLADFEGFFQLSSGGLAMSASVNIGGDFGSSARPRDHGERRRVVQHPGRAR